jgi:hypothetical protein
VARIDALFTRYVEASEEVVLARGRHHRRRRGLRARDAARPRSRSERAAPPLPLAHVLYTARVKPIRVPRRGYGRATPSPTRAGSRRHGGVT